MQYDLDSQEYFIGGYNEGDDLIPLNLRRTRKTNCKFCQRLFSIYIPVDVDFGTTICDGCSYEIRKKKEEYIIKNQLRSAMRDMFQDILDFGIRPDRIFQTQLFENYGFADLKDLEVKY